MTWGFSSYETRFRWAAAVWAILMTIWCMCPLPGQIRLIGAAIWLTMTLLLSLVIAWWRPRSERDVPIFLAFQNVGTTPKDVAHPEHTIHPTALESLICNLKAAGYRLQTASEAIHTPDRKSVVMTFDGGSRDAFFTLYPILRKHHAKATCLIPEHDPQDIDQLRVLEIQEMMRSGLVEFGATVLPEQATSPTLSTDIKRTRHWLIGVLGALPTLFSLPDGKDAQTVREAALAAGYTYLFTKGKYMRPVAAAPHDIHRRAIPGNRRPLQNYLLATRGRYRIGSTQKQTH